MTLAVGTTPVYTHVTSKLVQYIGLRDFLLNRILLLSLHRNTIVTRPFNLHPDI